METMQWVEIIKYVILFGMLLWLSVIDIREKIIPNKLLLLMLAGGLLLTFLTLNTAMYMQAFVGMGASLGIMLIFYFISRKGLGMGDVKLAAVAGLYIGTEKFVEGLFWSLVLVILFGGVMKILKKGDMKMEVPYAPFLTAGIFVQLIWSFLQ